MHDPDQERRRPAWRQALVDAETGLRVGLRADSKLIGFFFFASMAVLAGMVVGLASLHWAMMILCLGMALSAELLNQLLRHIASAESIRPTLREQTIRVGTTAVFVAQATAGLVIGILFWEHFEELWKR